MSDTIRDCPFCGSHAKLESSDDDGEYIACQDAACGASSNIQYSIKEDGRPLLLERWNRRAEITAQDGPIPDCACSKCATRFEQQYGMIRELEDAIGHCSHCKFLFDATRCTCELSDKVGRVMAMLTKRRDFECKAKKSSVDPPQDCNYPFCGCDSNAERVIKALLECGWSPNKKE